MGGNALSVETKRLDAKEFKLYEQEVCQKLSKKFKALRPTLYYKNKPSFGDLDIIVVKPKPDKEDLVKFLEEEFQTKEIYHNSDVISFEYQNFQIDLIFVPEENLEIAHFYFSYNDLNNLAGRISHKFNLKFGHEGLHWIVRDERGSLRKRFEITKDPAKIYEFLDLDYQKYLDGFDELEDIFNFVTSSKYFNSEIFAFENLNHQNRTRNRKRKTYAYFIEWLNSQTFNNHQFDENKESYIPMIEEFFEYPLSREIKIVEDEMAKIKFLATKFNGDIIMKLIPSLKDKTLGNFIESFKLHLKDFNKYIEEETKEKIESDIKIFYSYWINLKKK